MMSILKYKKNLWLLRYIKGDHFHPIMARLFDEKNPL